MKIGFVTCVQLGLSCIESIYKIGGKLDLLVTLNDDKARNKSGRIYLDEFSRQHQVELIKINHVNDPELLDAIKTRELDWLFIIGWSQIASEEVINAPKLGCIGIHPTLLPVGRGRAAIPWAILKGLDKTGITMFRLDEGVDTGEIIGQLEIPLTPNETANSLYTKVNEAHIKLMADSYPLIADNNIELKKQDEQHATYWAGRTPKDGEIKPDMTPEEVDRLVRATTAPYPGAFFYMGQTKIIVWKGEIIHQENQDPLNLTILNGKYRIDECSVEN